MNATEKATHSEVVVGRLKELLGRDKVRDDRLSIKAYSADISATKPVDPICIVFPENRDDVVTVLRVANEHRTPVTVQSGGVNVAGGTIVAPGGMAVDMRRMNRIIEINTDASYAIIEPGVKFDHFANALEARGFRCQIPTAPGGASPLANYISKPAGSLATRQLDAIVDLEVVLPDGTIFNTGSSAFPGVPPSLRYGPFPDIAGLFLCSYGTLGVITRASVRIYRRNESNRVNIAAFDSVGPALEYLKDVTAANVAEHTIIWNWQLYKVFETNLIGDEYKIPPETRLNPHQPPHGIPYNLVTTFMSGYEETMVSHEKVCAKVAEKYGGRILSDEEALRIVPGGVAGWTELYRNYRPLEPTFFGLGQYLPWIVMVEPKHIADLEKWAVDQCAEFNTPPVCYYIQPFDYGRSMMFRIFCFPDSRNQELVAKIVQRFRTMFDVAMKRYGAIPMRRRAGSPPALGLTGGYADVLTRIKRTLDPNNILSPNVHLFEDVTEKPAP